MIKDFNGNKLHLGKSEEVLKTFADNSVDMVLADLPYEITFCDWDKMIPFDILWEQYNRIVKKNGAIVLFAQQPFTSKLILSNLENFKYSLVWKKEKPSNVFNVKYQFGRIHEDICVFYRKQPTYNPQMQIRKNVTNPKPMKGDLNIDVSKNVTGVYKHSKDYNPYLIYPNSVLEFNRDSKKGNPALHPTQKPVKLLQLLIETFTNENDLVLDNTAGSSSTAIASINTKRRYYMIEKELKFFNISDIRITEHLKKNSINENN
jgi:DNA modification methylase